MIQLQDIEQAMTVKLDDFLPEKKLFFKKAFAAHLIADSV